MQRRSLIGATSTLAVLVSAVSLAWACVPGTDLQLSSATGRPGTLVTATVSGFPRDFPVQIRLESQTGTVLAERGPRAADGPFSEQIEIPSGLSAGCHVVLAFSTHPEHYGHGEAPAPFKVVTDANPNPSCTAPAPPARPPATPPATGGGIVNPVSAIVPVSGGKRINGTSRSERLTGTAFADVINCGAGNDRVSGGGGNDVINCGAGRDRVSGGAGDDEISGGSGNDKLAGGSGKDGVSGGSGKDKLSGGSGSDRLRGGAGNDTLKGNAGKDRLFGNGGADVLFRSGTDRLLGGSGRDRIIG